MKLHPSSGLFAPALLSAAIFALPATANERIQERATLLVTDMTGAASQVLSVQPAETLPGLSNATEIIYRDAAGQQRTMIMLPDGKHVIMGGIAKYAPTSNDSAVPPSAQPPSRQREAARGTTQELQHPADNQAPQRSTTQSLTAAFNLASRTYSTDTVLDLGDFRQDVFLRVFPDAAPEDAVGLFLQVLKQTNQIVEGSSDRVAYVFYDPLCPYCVKQHEALAPLIASGELTVAWVPVMSVSKAPYTYLKRLLDDGLNNADRLSRLKILINERPDPASVVLTNEENAQKRLMFNTSVMAMLRSTQSHMQSAGTPQSILLEPNGEVRHFYGFSDASNFSAHY